MAIGLQQAWILDVCRAMAVVSANDIWMRIWKCQLVDLESDFCGEVKEGEILSWFSGDRGYLLDGSLRFRLRQFSTCTDFGSCLSKEECIITFVSRLASPARSPAILVSSILLR